MAENQYPISNEDQVKLWEDCYKDALPARSPIAGRMNRDIPEAIALAQVIFSYRIQILSNRIIDRDMAGNLLGDDS